MLGNLFAGPHLIILLLIVLLLFGATRLPALAKSVGQSARIFKTEVQDAKADEAKADSATPAEPSSLVTDSSGSETHSKP